jgi:hypothetical protein
VKIVYTNLSEDDYGVKRSVKQLHLDFNGTSGQKDFSRDKKVREESKKGRLALVPNTLKQGRHNDLERGSRRAARARAEEFLYKTVEPVWTPESPTLAGYYINKFVKAQALGSQDIKKGAVIDIFA